MRARRLGHREDLPQPARELDLDRRRHLRARHGARDVAPSGAAAGMSARAALALLLLLPGVALAQAPVGSVPPAWQFLQKKPLFLPDTPSTPFS